MNPTSAFVFPRLSRDEQHLSVAQRLEHAFEQGREQGRQEGITEGIEQARVSLSDELETQLQQRLDEAARRARQTSRHALDTLAAAMQEQLTLHHDELAAGLYTLISTLSAHVIGQELQHAPTLARTLIGQALDSLRGVDTITRIRVGSELSAWLAEQHITEIHSLAVVTDTTLDATGVQFDGEQQLHSVSLKQRLDDMLEQVRHELVGTL